MLIFKSPSQLSSTWPHLPPISPARHKQSPPPGLQSHAFLISKNYHIQWICRHHLGKHPELTTLHLNIPTKKSKHLLHVLTFLSLSDGVDHDHRLWQNLRKSGLPICSILQCLSFNSYLSHCLISQHKGSGTVIDLSVPMEFQPTIRSW
jgi:hypothetical protein